MARSPLSARTATVSAWTTSGFVVWGGISGGGDACSGANGCRSPKPAGAVYDPAADAWRVMAPGPLDPDAASCSGEWDGRDLLIVCGDGRAAGYRPAGNTWVVLPPNPAGARRTPATVWDGRELLVYGGDDGSGRASADLTALDPVGGRWRPLPSAPIARSEACAIWTGSQLIVWGGRDVNGYIVQAHNDGAAYDPAGNGWAALPPSPLAGRYAASAAWTGKQLAIWGGVGTPTLFGDGALYDPARRDWATMPAGPLDPRTGPPSFWDGAGMLLWGSRGSLGDIGRADGARFDLETGRWSSLPASPLSPRGAPAAAWTGNRLLIWGGISWLGSAGSTFNDGATYGT